MLQIDLEDYKIELMTSLTEAWKLAKEHIEMAHQKRYHDWNSQAANLKVGDRVTTYIPSCCSMLFYNVI